MVRKKIRLDGVYQQNNDQGIVAFTQFMIAGVFLPLVVTYVLHYGVALRFNHVKAGDLTLEIK